MKEERNIELVGIDLVNYLMSRFNMDEDEVLNMLSRELGNVLGYDIGQMRLQFNPKVYLPDPIYRDENSGIWNFDNQNMNCSLLYSYYILINSYYSLLQKYFDHRFGKSLWRFGHEHARKRCFGHLW